MIRRGAGLAVALLGATVAAAAATPSVAVAAAPVAAAAAAPVAAASAAPVAAASAKTHVGLLVKYPTGTVTTWCVPYVAGMTGADVLAVAKPTYGSGPYAGFVLRIGGQGTVPPTASTYWAYWHSPKGTPGKYTYSTAGAGSTTPTAGSVDAWTWTSGTTGTFPHRTYAAICPAG